MFILPLHHLSYSQILRAIARAEIPSACLVQDNVLAPAYCRSPLTPQINSQLKWGFPQWKFQSQSKLNNIIFLSQPSPRCLVYFNIIECHNIFRKKSHFSSSDDISLVEVNQAISISQEDGSPLTFYYEIQSRKLLTRGGGSTVFKNSALARFIVAYHFQVYTYIDKLLGIMKWAVTKSSILINNLMRLKLEITILGKTNTQK